MAENRYDPDTRARLREQYLGEPAVKGTVGPPAHRNDRGRIVVTLNFNVPRSWRDKFGYPANVDAVDLLRVVVEEQAKGNLSLADLVAMAESVDVQVGK